MPKFIFLYLSKHTKDALSPSLLKALRGANLSLITITNLSELQSLLYKSLQQENVSPIDCILITDCDRAASLLKNSGGTCIGYMNSLETDSFLRNVHVVTDSLADIDLDFLTEEYNRVHHLPTTILTTERLVVRELTVDDIKEMVKLYVNPDYVRYIPPLSSLEEEQKKHEAYITCIYNYYRFGLWGVFLKSNNTLIGRCGLQGIEIGDVTEIELAYLIDERYSRKGYGYEATSHILKYAKEKLFLTHVVARIHKRNTASIALALRLGFYPTELVLPYDQTIYRIDFTE